ncbi:class I SAM-dependent methyltransferase [Kribbella sp. NPDC048915]|uniref:class I SAM-dependent methyltransferase n=1 Tax=Kribbella sp. NPDC048915 TaxID=3155148 RepID=UPI0033C7DB8E
MVERHTRPVPGGRAVYLTERLWELAEGLPVESVPIDSIKAFDEDCWFGGAAVTCRMVARHAALIQKADLSFPVILSADGRLMDGGHRISKAWISGATTIDAVRFVVDPEPDYIEPDPPGVVQNNRQYWEALAPARPGEPIEVLETGRNVLNEHERAAIGDIRGRRVLQLACSVGDEALVFARLGADVTAVDLAPSHLATGRAKAEKLDLTVDFREQDMMSLSEDLTGYDLIFISWGGLCWVPDLDAWTRLVADRLNPGGKLIVSEHHPLWEVLTVADEDRLRITGDYFTPDRQGYADPLKAPQITRTIGTPDIPHQSFVWSIGNLISAVLAAGLTLNSFQEFPVPDMYDGLAGTATRIPATYLLTAIR